MEAVIGLAGTRFANILMMNRAIPRLYIFMHPGVKFNHYSYRESVDKHNGWRIYPIAI